MSLLPAYKIGDCSIEGCGLKDTQGRKVGKNFICADHYRNAKQKEQVDKANTRNRVRNLVKYERAEGVLDSISELIIDLDRVTSRLVRLSAMGKDGKVQCFTCTTKKDFKQIQCGHFVPRANLVFRFDWTYNLRPQCKNCNVTLRGNLKVFEENLEKERPGIVEWMQEESRKVYSPTRDELKQTLHDYQLKLNTVENAKLKML